MSILAEHLRLVTVAELFASDLRVPSYQRPYRWEPKQAMELLEDVRSAMGSELAGVAKQTYTLGSVILHRDEEGCFQLVDGQQRLLTLLLIRGLLHSDGADFIEDPSSSVGRVRARLAAAIRPLDPGERERILGYLDARCTFVQIVTDNLDEAFRFFDAQNYRGKSLAPHDLLKAHHLRAMGGSDESEAAIVAEEWERRSDDILGLFERHLHRISRWCRGEDAFAFTERHIDIFKGFGDDDRTPHAGYHRRARDVAGAVPAWDWFQLDLPAPAGRAFFEMVSFVLGERDKLFEFARESPWDGVHAGRHTYVAALYECALLYAMSRFGEEAARSLRPQLFHWAYALRLDQERVTWRSVNKYALGGGTVADERRNAYNLFMRLRNARDVREVRQIEVSSAAEARSDKDGQLLERIRSSVNA